MSVSLIVVEPERDRGEQETECGRRAAWRIGLVSAFGRGRPTANMRSIEILKTGMSDSADSQEVDASGCIAIKVYDDAKHWFKVALSGYKRRVRRKAYGLEVLVHLNNISILVNTVPEVRQTTFGVFKARVDLLQIVLQLCDLFVREDPEHLTTLLATHPFVYLLNGLHMLSDLYHRSPRVTIRHQTFALIEDLPQLEPSQHPTDDDPYNPAQQERLERIRAPLRVRGNTGGPC